MIALVAVLLALATPAPAPKPTATNPFTLTPIAPPAASLPVIGGTRAKPICTAIRRAVAPAVEAALKTDRTYSGLRKTIYDYVVKDTEAARDLHLMQMDRHVDEMVKTVDTLEQALKSPALVPGPTTKPDDVKILHDLQGSLGAVLRAQKVQLDAMSGFVETERMRRFGTLSESEENLRRSNAPTGPKGVETQAPLSAFLRDSQTTFGRSRTQTVTTMHDAMMLDRDLGDIAAYTTRSEDVASKIIIPAANACK